MKLLWIKTILISGLLLLLSACGGGGGDGANAVTNNSDWGSMVWGKDEWK